MNPVLLFDIAVGIVLVFLLVIFKMRTDWDGARCLARWIKHVKNLTSLTLIVFGAGIILWGLCFPIYVTTPYQHEQSTYLLQKYYTWVDGLPVIKDVKLVKITYMVTDWILTTIVNHYLLATGFILFFVGLVIGAWSLIEANDIKYGVKK